MIANFALVWFEFSWHQGVLKNCFLFIILALNFLSPVILLLWCHFHVCFFMHSANQTNAR